jgi:hypothetical protein
MGQNAIVEIVVRGEHIKTEIAELPVESLSFWPDNPRVIAVVAENRGFGPVTQDQIDAKLWEQDYVHVLSGDIEEHGGLIDEIVVQANTVLEGNLRLCAYRHLLKRARERNDSAAIATWSHMRARIMPSELRPELVFALLGKWHITGKQQWTPYEKAAFMRRMSSDFRWTDERVADSVGQTVKSVQDNIQAYNLMTDNGCQKFDKFSHFYELVKNKRLDELKPELPDLVKKTVEAIMDDRFGRAEEIRDLHKVVKDKAARRQFFEEGCSFSDAFETAKEHHPENADSFFKHMKKVTEDLRDCPTECVEEIRKEAQKKYILKNLRTEVNRVWNLVDSD